MGFILKDGQKVGLTLELTDADGNVVTGQGDPVWESSDPALVAISPNGAAATASTTPGPGTGTATVTARVDADLGEGVKEVTGTLDIEVVAGDASVVNIVAGTPEDRDAAAPPPIV